MPGWLAWLLGIGATGIGAYLIARVTGLLNWITGRFNRKVLGQAPLQVARVQPNVAYARQFMDVPSWVVAAPVDQVPPPPSHMLGEQERDRWAQEIGAVDARWTSALVTVTGTADQVVVIQDVKIHVHERRPAIVGTHVIIGMGDFAAVRWIQFDLDSDPPKMTQSIDYRTSMVDGTETPVAFPFEVSKSKTETFFIVGRTRKYDCEWTAKLLWTCGQDSGTLTIDNAGKPFRTSGTADSTTYISKDGSTFVQRNDGAD